ncbi:hypothetical protein AB0N20_22875 [Streptomyces griseoincarnatus]|nr:hypothetical protein [Streptomyces sp. RK31]MBQ0976109.1 hypothetical protein [Streptomyces sp. RK31]
MDWWVWLVAVVMLLAAGTGILAGVQTRRRRGGVIVVRRTRPKGKGKAACTR